MSYEKLELFCHEEVLIVMRCGASFLLFWQEQGQFCLDKPLDEYQRVSHEKPLIFNPAPYLTQLWKWIVNKRRAKASLLSSQMTDSANRCRTEPRESQVLRCRPSEVWGGMLLTLCPYAIHLFSICLGFTLLSSQLGAGRPSSAFSVYFLRAWEP